MSHASGWEKASKPTAVSNAVYGAIRFQFFDGPKLLGQSISRLSKRVMSAWAVYDADKLIVLARAHFVRLGRYVVVLSEQVPQVLVK